MISSQIKVRNYRTKGHEQVFGYLKSVPIFKNEHELSYLDNLQKKFLISDHCGSVP